MAPRPPEYVVRGAQAAGALRLELDLGAEPIRDLWSMIRGLDGLDLGFHPFGAEGPDGAYRYDGRDGLIVVNSDKTPLSRQRFTAAHELGHHMLHREVGRPLNAADADIESGTDDGSEKEANAFAGYLLAPEAAMARAFDNKPARDILIEDVVDLMHEFGTSFRTTVYRLHNSGRIAAVDRDRLLGEGEGQIEWLRSVKGYDRDELPAGSALPPHYVVTVLRLHDSGVIDDERLAALLRTTVPHALTLVRPQERESRQAAADEALAAAFGDLDELSELTGD